MTGLKQLVCHKIHSHTDSPVWLFYLLYLLSMKATLHTTKGAIVIELNDQTPNTSANFAKLPAIEHECLHIFPFAKVE